MLNYLEMIDRLESIALSFHVTGDITGCQLAKSTLAKEFETLEARNKELEKLVLSSAPLLRQAIKTWLENVRLTASLEQAIAARGPLDVDAVSDWLRAADAKVPT